jgi:hypothetical protein
MSRGFAEIASQPQNDDGNTEPNRDNPSDEIAAHRRNISRADEIPLQRFVPNGEILVPVEAALDLAPQAEKQDHAYRPLSVPRRDVPKKSS